MYFTVTPKHTARFHNEGYLIVRQLLTCDESNILGRIAKNDREMDQSVKRMDRSGLASKLRVNNELDAGIYSSIARCRRLVRTMEAMLGDEVYHFHHKMMVKEPRVGGAWEWHQDYGYWYTQQSCLWPDMASCMIAVDRSTRENGCLQVLKASHRCGRIDHGAAGEQVGADPKRVDALTQQLDLVHVELDPGDGLFFHSNLLHRSDQNRSKDPRWTLICCYNTRHNSPYCDKHSHPAYTPLESVADQEVLAIGKRQWATMQAGIQ